MDSETKGAGRGLKEITCLMVISLSFFLCSSVHAQCSGPAQQGVPCHGYILSGEDISNPDAQCSDMSPKLVKLLDCMNGYLPERAKVLSSVSDSAGIENCIPSEWSRPPCAHVRYSCHYGGRTCTGESYAVDFKNRVCLPEIRKAFAYCGGGRIKKYGSHIHVSIGCENGCDCDCSLEKVEPLKPEFNAVAMVGEIASEVDYKSVTVDINEIVYFDASDSIGTGAYSWVFGDGSSGSGEATSHRYSAEGTFTVTLTFTGSGPDLNKIDTDTVTVKVVDFRALAYVGETPKTVDKKTITIGVGGTAYFDASDSIGTGGFKWDFKDGSFGSGEATSHRYSAEGTFTVTLTFTGSGPDLNKIDTDTVTVVVEEYMPPPTSPLNVTLLHKCSCTGICRGREITAQAVKRSEWNVFGYFDPEKECCNTCLEIWGELCGGYANCREGCESCCSGWCVDIMDDDAREQCTAVCVSGCEGYQNVSGLLGLFSTILIILAAVLFAVHALALIVSFGPYERSEAKRSIKYVIIALLLLAVVVNIVNMLFFPFRSPGGATTTPTCINCSLITECSDYSMSFGYQDCIYNICSVPGICYVNKHNNCVSCSSSPPSGCGDYGGVSCTMNPCGVNIAGGGCMVDTMTSECIEVSGGDGDECTDECSSGQTRCVGSNQIETCGNYDEDKCLELGDPQNCPEEQICQNGVCVEPVGETIIIFAHQDDDLLWMLPFWKESDKFILAALPTTPSHMNVVNQHPDYYKNNWVPVWGQVSIEEYKNFWLNTELRKTKITYNNIKTKLRPYFLDENIKKVITHNNWGEYGHIHHRLVNKVVRDLAVEYGKEVWMLSMVRYDPDTPGLPYKNTGTFGLEYVTTSFDGGFFREIRSIYQQEEASPSSEGLNIWSWHNGNNEYPQGSRTFVKVVDNGNDLSIGNPGIQYLMDNVPVFGE